MKITYELDLNKFEAWSGGQFVLDKIIGNNRVEQFMIILENLYPNGMTETELNDYLRFNESSIYEALGIRDKNVIGEELSNVENKMEELEVDWEELSVFIHDLETEIDNLLQELSELNYWDDNDKDRCDKIIIELSDNYKEKEEKKKEIKVIEDEYKKLVEIKEDLNEEYDNA